MKTLKQIKRKMQTITKPVKEYIETEDVHLQNKYISYYENLTPQKEIILLEAQQGSGFVGAPYALYKKMLHYPSLKNATFYWVYEKGADVKSYMSNLPEIERTSFVERDSDLYVRLLASAGYLINDDQFPSYFIKKEGQVYIHTGQAFPMEKMGYALGSYYESLPLEVHQLFSSDYLFSYHPTMTQMYLKDYLLDGLYTGKILEAGNPAQELTISADIPEVLAKLSLVGLTVDLNKKTILYVPQKREAENQVAWKRQLLADVRQFKEQLNPEYNFLVSLPHEFYDEFSWDADWKDILIPNYYDLHEVLSIADLLITDYHAIAYDFLATKQPVLFYAYDQELMEEKGQFSLQEKAFGPIVHSVDEACQKIIEGHWQEWCQEAYKDNYQKYYPHGSFSASIHYLKAIFSHNTKEVHLPKITQKEQRFLFFPGFLTPSYWTDQWITLLHCLIAQNYDVSLLLDPIKTNQEQMNRLPNGVRIFYFYGEESYTTKEVYIDRVLTKYSLRPELKALYPKEAYIREMRRLTSGATFTAAVDYYGYKYRWSKYILAANAEKKAIDLPETLAEELQYKEGQVDRGIFYLYPEYDRILLHHSDYNLAVKTYLSHYQTEEQWKVCDYPLPNPKEEPLRQLSSKIQTLNKKVYVLNSQEYSFFTDLDTKETTTIWLSEEEPLQAVARTLIEGQLYVLVWQNQQRLGWMLAHALYQEPKSEKKIQILETSTEQVDYLKSVKMNEEGFVYATPEDAYQKEDPKFGMYWLQQMNWRIRRVEVINDGSLTLPKRFAYLTTDNRAIGWIDESYLSDVYVQENQARKAFVEQLVSSEERQGFYVLETEKEVSAFVDWEDLWQQKSQKEVLPKGTVQVNWEIKTQTETYVQVILEDNRTYWIPQSALQEAKEIAYLVETEEEPKVRTWKSSYVPVYATVEEFLASVEDDSLDDHTKQVDEETPVMVQKEVKTAYDILYGFKEEGKEYFSLRRNFLSPEENLSWMSWDGNVLPSMNEQKRNLLVATSFIDESLRNLFFSVMKKVASEKKNLRVYVLGGETGGEMWQEEVTNAELNQQVFILSPENNKHELLQQAEAYLELKDITMTEELLLEALGSNKVVFALETENTRRWLEKDRFGLCLEKEESVMISALQQWFHRELHFATWNVEKYNQYVMKEQNK